MTLDNFRTQKIIWDRANKKIFEKIEANSGDSNGRKLVVQVINQEATENISGTTLSLGWKSRNGAKGLDAFNLVDASKGIFEIYYTTEMLSNIGNLEASLILIDSTGRIESSTFTISVRPSTVDDESVESENSFTALTEALVKVNDFDAQLAQTEQVLNERVSQTIATAGDGTVPSELTDMRVMVDGSTVTTAGDALRKTQSGDAISEKAITSVKIDKNIKPNLLDVNNVMLGKAQIGIGSVENPYRLANSTTIDVSNPIPCTIGKEYTIPLSDISYPVYLYNASDNVIGHIMTANVLTPVTFTIPNVEGVSHFKVNMRTSKVPLSEYVIVEGNDLNLGIKHEVEWLRVTEDNLDTYLKDKISSGTSPSQNNWYSKKKGKKIITFGNSRTWYDSKNYGVGTKEEGAKVRGYQTYIREQLGMDVVNVGVSGSRIHQTVDLIKNHVFTGDEYAISLMHGTNNFNAVASGEVGYSLGTVDPTKSGDYDVMSYAGGLQEFVEWVSINKPGLKMYLMTDAWCYKGGYGGMDREYSDIMREVAELYHYPFLDLYHMCGFNENNMNEYFVDSGSNLFHENTKGYERTSEIIVPFIANH